MLQKMIILLVKTIPFLVQQNVGLVTDTLLLNLFLNLFLYSHSKSITEELHILFSGDESVFFQIHKPSLVPQTDFPQPQFPSSPTTMLTYPVAVTALIAASATAAVPRSTKQEFISTMRKFNLDPTIMADVAPSSRSLTKRIKEEAIMVPPGRELDSSSNQYSNQRSSNNYYYGHGTDDFLAYNSTSTMKTSGVSMLPSILCPTRAALLSNNSTLKRPPRKIPHPPSGCSTWPFFACAHHRLVITKTGNKTKRTESKTKQSTVPTAVDAHPTTQLSLLMPASTWD